MLRNLKFQVLQTYTGNSGRLNTVCFSHDGGTIMGGGCNHAVYIWNTVSGVLIKPLFGHGAPIQSIAIHPYCNTNNNNNNSANTNQFVSCSEDHQVCVWDDYKPVPVVPMPNHNPVSMPVSVVE